MTGTDIRAALAADGAVSAAVSKVNTTPCIVVDSKEPTAWPKDGAGLTIYQATPRNAAMEYTDEGWTVNCRAASYVSSQALAVLVVTALNRKSINGISGRAYCQQLATLQPADSADNYNTPVEVRVKRS